MDSGTLTAAEIRNELGRVTKSSVFKKSARMVRFLNTIVKYALSGSAEDLKEYTLALEVFDKISTFDPRYDSIVRVEARRLRWKLRMYYQGEGKDDPVIIELREGTYVPEFRRPGAAQEPTLRPSPSGAIRRIAVLPIADVTLSGAAGRLCDALEEELTDIFTRLPGVRVVPRRTTLRSRAKKMDTREIARRFNVAIVCDGSVRDLAGSLRISIRLINASDGITLWSSTYEGASLDQTVSQADITATLSRDLSVYLTGPQSFVA